MQSDRNYQIYLGIVFNTIYESARNRAATIIPCGGPTKCDQPYRGTEGEMIAACLTDLLARDEVKQYVSSWRIIPETQSLSTLENLLFAKKLMEEQHLAGSVTIFCEKTREERLKAFAHRIFGSDALVQSIDFDLSKNRYLDPEVLATKEAKALNEGLWTLEEPNRIKKHHELFEQKLAFLRRRQSEGLSHVDAVEEWFKNEKEIIFE